MIPARALCMFSNSQSVYFRSSFVTSSTTVPLVQGVGEIARPWASPVRAASHSKKKKVTITRRQINTGFIVAVLSTCWLSPNSLSSEGPDGRVQGACPMLLRPAMPA